LKDSLEKLNIPLIGINSDTYKTLPQDLSSFAVEKKINHVFCNHEFGINETKRDQNSAVLLNKYNIQFSSFNDQVIYSQVFSRLGKETLFQFLLLLKEDG